ncbi:hypothetical protein EJB05_36839, partial [Eragrostis curvula]
MAGPSSGGFPWTPQYIERALDTIWRAVREHRDDPFRENNLAQAVSRLNATIPTTSHTIAPQHLTTNDLRALLEDQRQLYHRVCELANHPSVLGFSSTTFKIMMLPDQYASHIQAFPEDKELIDNPIPNFFYLFMFFGGGCMPGSRRRRHTSSNRSVSEPSNTTTSRRRNTARRRAPATRVQPNANDDEDDDFMPMPPSRPLPPLEDPDDEAFSESVLRERPSNSDFSVPPRSQSSSNPYSMDINFSNMSRRWDRTFP